MSQEFIPTRINQEAHEKNLIAALNRLQNTLFDAEFLDANTQSADELPPEPFFGFVIGDYSFIVSATCFCEVFVDTPIAALPNSPESLVGLSNLRGVLLPVYQLHSAMNLNLPKKNTIFCIGKGDAAVGLLIDVLPVSLSLNRQQRIASTNCKVAFLQPLIKASYLSNQTEWYLLDGDAFGEQLQAVANQAHRFSARTKNNYETAHS